MKRSTTRRTVRAAAVGVVGSVALAACVGGGGGGQEPATEDGETSAGTEQPAGREITLQSNMQDEGPMRGLAAVVEGIEDYDVTVNTVATSQFRAQLPTYLSSSQPPDILTWYAGSVAQSFAEEGLLADLSEVWTGDGQCADLSDALRDLSTYEDQQIFVPTNYYWWAIFYKKSAFEEWGIEVPQTWEEFMAVNEQLVNQGVYPLTNGLANTAWMASAWFDYLNLRINGADYHRELLSGGSSFDSPEVREVMETYAELIPYFHPNASSWDAQQAAGAVARNEAAMYLVGTFATEYFPEDQQEDLDFFSVPVIDPSVPHAEEGPTDGYIVAANSDNLQGATDVANYLCSPEAQLTFIEESGSLNLPTSPEVDISGMGPLIQKGSELLNDAEQLTQFFNRDSSDELQATADAALTRFLANPQDLDAILADWQAAAEGVFGQ